MLLSVNSVFFVYIVLFLKERDREQSELSERL